MRRITRIAAVAVALIVTLIVTMLLVEGARAQEDVGVRFRTKDLIGTWAYQDAYVQLPDGTTTRNFGPTPRGLFVIRPGGHYSHIVMANDLPPAASGQLKVLTNAEAQAIATNVLAHFGTWTSEPRAGRFTVKIEKSSFANFDGVDQVRVVQVLSRTTLQYRNLLVTNGPGASVVAVLKRMPDQPRHGHR